jgi:hypothetical protein
MYRGGGGKSQARNDREGLHDENFVKKTWNIRQGIVIEFFFRAAKV